MGENKFLRTEHICSKCNKTSKSQRSLSLHYSSSTKCSDSKCKKTNHSDEGCTLNHNDPKKWERISYLRLIIQTSANVIIVNVIRLIFLILTSYQHFIIEMSVNVIIVNVMRLFCQTLLVL